MAPKMPQLKLSLPSLGGLTSRFSLPFMARGEALALGLDIGSHAVKACELQRSGSGYLLKSLGSALMPPDTIEDGALVEPAAVAGVIGNLLGNLGSRNKKVAISVSGYSVIVKKINLRVMSSEELEKHLHEEAEQYIPFDIDDVYLDCQDLHTNTGEDDHTDIMLVAAKKELVDGYLGMLEDLGLETVVVDVDAFALENAFEAAGGPDESAVLVDIGASKMNINIVSGGASALARDVILGGRQLTEQIQRALDISFEEAEEIKLGLTPAPENARQRVEKIVLEACRQWSAEIKRALDFHQTTSPEQAVERIVLSGGGANIAGLADLFSQENNLPTTIFNPFARAVVDQKRIDPAYLRAVAPSMAQAAGLATRLVEF
ncbi:MAG TPA: type IV pilus assembly protein PilM [Desulfurivibrio alkaliphilus]|mgnify:CR=1 FL=1|uniref:Type IV pilus assembly protein PilM n=1 Tax=Desulfurivibrio alkaliphilus TaxID=427923 RepID=A0A7C2THL6_9BACT|nr:type IV pilus assembly protein PilM [Desulfurivibrio alkaliphilus]